jgi:hypothetical protein
MIKVDLNENCTKEEEELIREFHRKERRLQLENALKERLNRARGITVGTAFGGTVEINMRANGGEFIWAILQPVETVELINQLAAAIGCHIHIQPREDFASWRHWKHSEEELAHFRGPGNKLGNGHPPHAKSDGDEKYKTSLPSLDKQPGLNPALRSDQNEQTVATEKPVKRDRAKRSATAA